MTFKTLPNHIGIIVDGNRRWAVKRGLPAIAGHKYVVDKMIEPIIYRCLELGVSFDVVKDLFEENFFGGKGNCLQTLE